MTFNLTGQLWEDKSVASASGLLSTALKWDEEIIDFLGLKRDQLPQPVSATHRTNMNKGVKHLEDVPIYLGAGDGMLAHLATAGLNPKYLSSTIGTSGALRVATNKPILDQEGKIWSYNLFNDWWVSWRGDS